MQHLAFWPRERGGPADRAMMPAAAAAAWPPLESLCWAAALDPRLWSSTWGPHQGPTPGRCGEYVCRRGGAGVAPLYTRLYPLLLPLLFDKTEDDGNKSARLCRRIWALPGAELAFPAFPSRRCEEQSCSLRTNPLHCGAVCAKPILSR